MMFLRHGLRKGTLFHVNVGLCPPGTLDDFLRRAQCHIDFQESNEAIEGTTTSAPAKGKEAKEKQKKDGGGPKEWLARFIDYFPSTRPSQKSCKNVLTPNSMK